MKSLPSWSDNKVPESPDSFPGENVKSKTKESVEARNKEKPKPIFEKLKIAKRIG